MVKEKRHPLFTAKLVIPFQKSANPEHIFNGNDIEVGTNLGAEGVSLLLFHTPQSLVKFVSYAPVCLANSTATPSLREASLSIFPKGDPA